MAEKKQINISDERAFRLEKLKRIREVGINPYADKFEKRQSISQAITSTEGDDLKTAGRIITIREMGKICFCHIQDSTGKMQLVLKQDEIGKEKFSFFVKNIDPADFVGVVGERYTTQKGEASILVKEYQLLSKALRPLPEKWHGLKDQESLYRQRYLDLISNKETYDRFVFRSKFIQLLRQFYWQEGFIEVETPILTNTASGAMAKPFKTHHNALDTDLYLRIAPETYLKECVVGGFEKVFELGRLFRNEGIDPSHLQDYTSVEHYAAYWDYQDNMRFTEKLLSFLLKELFGSLVIPIKDRDGKIQEVDFSAPWPVKTFRELILADSGIDIDQHETVESLREAITKKKINIENIKKLGRGNLIDELYKEVSRKKIIQPTFITSHPIDISPLARRNDDNHNQTDRFQLLVNGWEIVNAYSELVDAVDQKERFETQASAKDKGDEEAHGKDDEFVLALEHGAPPMSGWGMGIDRIVTLLTQQDNLRDVVLFPLMRPQK
jgi:lysyl-tRNA synthetase class 2